jgi:hypothetical protein
MLSQVKSWESFGKVEVIWVPVSKQKGSTECGVFVCEMMRLAARDDSVELETTTENINRLRHIIAFELLQRRLLEDPQGMPTSLFTDSPNRNLKNEDARLGNQDQQPDDMVPKGKEVEEWAGEDALTGTDELGQGGEEEEEEEEEEEREREKEGQEGHTKTEELEEQSGEENKLQTRKRKRSHKDSGDRGSRPNWSTADAERQCQELERSDKVAASNTQAIESKKLQ